jgi:hypothetical protein
MDGRVEMEDSRRINQLQKDEGEEKERILGAKTAGGQLWLIRSAGIREDANFGRI